MHSSQRAAGANNPLSTTRYNTYKSVKENERRRTR
ncbi:hypothetical protein FOXG_19268 [Fusarium oxysporum f. sp. lycopersici 4287]|uniref:Uncharacterized protein n=1 Tax=Fusarium oxysporum f. sp. lycopersici (strain 4287 / CBS 123668 / FGSC 9935 / NRRL 34936) TaxID=426428 RepID=A0A0J9UZJ5_FUSO4|nr:hypothetical protein FOXG_19268 [Fusarium oxysporum f. sp. lycopersici 4287]KNB04333.1 hypothetical protein FOXG_19268 [Fusarium oxysporum f. sp. lycopersici 4287]